MGKKAATLKQFDEDAELERLRRVYEEIEEMLSTLEECVEIQKALSKTQTSGGHHERCQQWVKKAREKHLGTADTTGKATDSGAVPRWTTSAPGTVPVPSTIHFLSLTGEPYGMGVIPAA